MLVAAILLLAGGAAGADPALIECMIAPHTTMLLSTPVEGQLESVTVDRGGRVEAGQVVANLEASVERAQFALARTRLEYEQRRQARSEALFEKNVISAQELDDLRSETEIAEKEFERAAALMERRVIRSPIDGVVVKRLLEPGEYSQPSQLLEIARTGVLRVEAYAPAALFGRVEPGSQAEVTPRGLGGPPLHATVTVVDPVVDPGSGMFGVRLELPNDDGRLPAGIGCEVRLSLSARTRVSER